jgi:DNA-binding response OmpR family regulator
MVSQAAGPACEQRAKALVVEDDADLGPCIHEILDEGGYSTVLAKSLAEARAQLALEPFDVVVLDVMLGGDHARDLLADFAAAADAPPTLLVSAARDAAGLAESYGITLVAKPFDMDVFLDEVARVRREGKRPSTPAAPRVV